MDMCTDIINHREQNVKQDLQGQWARSSTKLKL